MDAEFLELARAATGALQMQAAAAMRGPSWVEVVQACSSVVGLSCIVGGLFSMKAAGKRRDREIDAMVVALERQGEAMTQAFTQQGEALRQQGDAMTQAFTQQGEALRVLIERTAPR